MDNRPFITAASGILLVCSICTLALANDAKPARQTEFNDHNYRPSRQINISRSVTPTPRTRSEPQQRRIQSATEQVKWTNASGLETQYELYYEYDDTYITFASVCSNYRKGSINYRNCRKAAKQWFGSKCNNGSSNGRMYCHARNAFLP